MSNVKIGAGDWVIVCDGAKALVLENVGDAKFPNLKTREVFEEKHPATHDLGASAPGRAVSPAGHGRSAVEQGDLHDQAERRFLERLAGHLDAAIAAGKTKSLIIVAPPRALGMIRPAYSYNVRSALRAEVDKDLVKLPVHEIEKHLAR